MSARRAGAMNVGPLMWAMTLAVGVVSVAAAVLHHLGGLVS